MLPLASSSGTRKHATFTSWDPGPRVGTPTLWVGPSLLSESFYIGLTVYVGIYLVAEESIPPICFSRLWTSLQTNCLQNVNFVMNILPLSNTKGHSDV